MNVEYMRTAKKSYMIVKGADFPCEPYELTMVLRNKISCLLPFQVILENGEAQYWYDVGGMQSLKTRFSTESLDARQIRLLLESLTEMKSTMEAYLLDDADICFSAEMICCDRTRERICFCYIPGLGSTGEGLKSSAAGGRPGHGPKELFEEILQHINHGDPAAVQMAYEMYERCACGSFTVEDCMDCLRLGEQAAADRPGAPAGEQDSLRERSAKGSPAAESGSGQPEQPEFEPEEDIEFLLEESEPKPGHRKKRKKEKTVIREEHREGAWGKWKKRSRREEPEENELLFSLRTDRSERSEAPRRYGYANWPGDLRRPSGSPRPEAVCDPEESRTEVIREGAAVRAWELSYKGTGMETDLAPRDFPFLIGTDGSRVNGVLHARTVSRVHAKLFVEDGRLFLEDFNSTNGTYLNHELLPMSTPTEVKEGDRIVFATEEYAVYSRHTL